MGAEVRWDHVVTEPEHLLELKAYCCENCGYTLFPARGVECVQTCFFINHFYGSRLILFNGRLSTFASKC